MAEAAIEFVRRLLENRWRVSTPGRNNPVPEPQIHEASENHNTRVSQINSDVIFVRDGGPQDFQAKGVGWDHREETSLVTVDVRTTVSRKRLEGKRDRNNEKEKYGGLQGEVSRIIDEVRRGHKEFDLITPMEWRDLSEEMGYQFYRKELDLSLDERAKDINP